MLVLMDLGGAVLSAELALDLLPEERRRGVLLTEAPLVEGAVAAAVAAARGGSLREAAAEARGGLAGKAAHLAPGLPPAGQRPAEDAAGPELRLVVRNRLGLHARPAALFVRTAARFEADVTIANVTAGRGPVGSGSLNAVATLGVRQGDEIVVRASGRQAAEALAALSQLAAEDFGDPPEAGGGSRREHPLPPEDAAAAAAPAGRDLHAARPVATIGPVSTIGPVATIGPVSTSSPPCRPAPGSVLQGLGASPGLATGKARRLEAAPAVLLAVPPLTPRPTGLP